MTFPFSGHLTSSILSMFFLILILTFDGVSVTGTVPIPSLLTLSYLSVSLSVSMYFSVSFEPVGSCQSVTPVPFGCLVSVVTSKCWTFVSRS